MLVSASKVVEGGKMLVVTDRASSVRAVGADFTTEVAVWTDDAKSGLQKLEESATVFARGKVQSCCFGDFRVSRLQLKGLA